jgi:integrase/recombinase XerD
LDENRYADRRLKVMLLIALDTGLRRGELCGLKLEDFDPEGMLLTVRAETSKVRRGRVVPLSSQVAREIRRFVALRPIEWSTPYLFPTEQGGKMNPDNFGLQIRRTSIRIDKPMKIHGLRHLCATEFLRSTGNIALTARLLGHTSIRTTAEFYEHLNLDDLREAHEKANVIHGVMGKSRKRTL